MLNKDQVTAFWRCGYLNVSSLLLEEQLVALQELAQRAACNPQVPYETEAMLGYPGSPEADSSGKNTTRRLLNIYDRGPVWQNVALAPSITESLSLLFNEIKKIDSLKLSRAHHNCLMTKHPIYSSETGWHQDIRYWSFSEPNLISAWIALGDENPNNGGLWLIPESHRWSIPDSQFNNEKFFEPTDSEYQSAVRNAIPVDLQAGDVLFFHARLLHRASRNHTNMCKLSLVFTYHSGDIWPRPNTRSASIEEVTI